VTLAATAFASIVAMLAATSAAGANAAGAPEAEAAATHWRHAHGDLEVVSASSAGDAVAVGQRLSALDAALRGLLHLPNSAGTPPTRVYLLPGAELAAIDPVWAAQGGAFFRAAPFDEYLVLASEHGAAVNAELYAARTLSLLASWGLARLPDWYRQGVAQLAAGVVFGDGKLTVGQDVADQAGRLARDWYSMGKIFHLPASNPEFSKDPGALALYQAQCWWLVHLLLIERVLDPTVSQYVERQMAGQREEVAFANSFNANYDQLDEYFRKVRRSVQLRTYAADMPGAAEAGAAQPLGENAYRASVAELALDRNPQSAAALQMTRDVLAADPDNERALLALARAGIAARHFAEASAILERLHARGELTGAARRDLATQEASLARQKEDGLPGTQELDARKLRADARADFRRALEADPADLRALYQLSWLQATLGDVVGVRALLPSVEAAFYGRPDSPELAALLVRMSSLAGSPADVFKYSVAQQRLAPTEAERASAAARVERLRPQVRAAQ
jgi:Tfp pilus assembly protein PilF